MSVDRDAYVSTGHLPTADDVRALLAAAHERYRTVDDGALSSVYPALGQANANQFGICVTGTTGAAAEAGDADAPFSIMSVAKPFVFALVCSVVGPDEVRRAVGVNATGLPFNSAAAIERSRDGRTNPMVNPGAIATTALVPGGDADAKWTMVHERLSQFAARPLAVDDEIYRSATAANQRNRGLAALLWDSGRLAADPAVALEVYTRQSSLRVTARDLAVMGATLAGGGVNPRTGRQVVDPVACRCTLAVMATGGLYETSGEWLYEVGLPGKSGIGGGIVTVAPGKGGLGTYAPRLDDAGNSVRGQLATRFLSQRLGLDLFASEPAR